MKNQILKNVSWIVGCRIIQALLNLIVGMLSARYLGSSNYGLINYAASIVSFVTPLMRLGLNSILVQELIADEENEAKILGTTLGLTILSGFSSILIIIGFVSVVNKGEPVTIIVCAISSLSLVFQAAEMITYWYQAKLLAKYPSIAMVCGYVVISVYKIYLLAAKKSVYWFAASNAIDHLVIGLVLFTIYLFIGKHKLQFSIITAKKMLSKSKYYIVSGMMITVLQQTDKIMLKNMVGNQITGYYSAAVTCAGIFGFVYAAFVDSMRPEIFKAKKILNERYEYSLSCTYSIIFYVSLLQCLFTTLLAEPIILFLYGEEYLPAVSLLRVVVWYITYAYFGTIRGVWILAEEKYKLVIGIDILGAIINVVLNMVLIPFWGAIGAAIASVITQFVLNFVLGFIIRPLRRNAILMLRGISPSFAMEQIRILLRVGGKHNDNI